MPKVQVRAQLPRLLLEDQVVMVPEAAVRQELAGGAVLPRPATASTSWKWAFFVSLAAFVALGLLLIAMMALIKDPNFSQAPVAAIEGLTIFAAFYVVAQAIERLLEPISTFVLPKEEKATGAAKKLNEAATQVRTWTATLGTPQVEAARADAEDALATAAVAKANLEQRGMERTVVFWALATAIAMWASAALHLYFLRTVGISGAKRWLEVLATGLIVGAGTKPLHDLITRISASAKRAEEEGSVDEV